MSVPPVIQYPLDRTGTSETNKVVGERREINIASERAFVPKAGPFFANSFILYNADTMEPLRPVDDYILAQPHAQAAQRTGLDVQSVVVLKVPTPIAVTYDYQVVGGEYSWNLEGLQALIDELTLDDRAITWGSVIGRPTAYPPTPHIHDIGDTFGWEYVVWQLERITNAILVGDEASHDELRAQIQYVRDELIVLVDAVNGRVDEHVGDFNNPHQVTKQQVGLGDVDNYLTATPVEAYAGTANNRFMTPSAVTILAEKIADSLLDVHLADLSNPHQVTKVQVGLGNVDNFLTATQVDAVSGVINTKFMTPLRTKEAIMAIIGNDYLTHKASTNNPHNVTKAQTGLGSVDNYPSATSAEGIAGVATNRFMTPATTKAAIDSQVADDYRLHKANLSNPHAVTAAQVGTYTTGQSDALLNTKLGKTETAVNSSKLEGASHAQVLASAYAQVGSMGKRNVFISTSDPSAGAGAVGDVWFKY